MLATCHAKDVQFRKLSSRSVSYIQTLIGLGMFSVCNHKCNVGMLALVFFSTVVSLTVYIHPAVGGQLQMYNHGIYM